jgi:hypothetical protein
VEHRRLKALLVLTLGVMLLVPACGSPQKQAKPERQEPPLISRHIPVPEKTGQAAAQAPAWVPAGKNRRGAGEKPCPAGQLGGSAGPDGGHSAPAGRG